MSPVPLSPMSPCLCVPGPSQQSQLTHTHSHAHSHTYSYTHLHSHTCSQAQTSALFTSPPPQLPSPSLSPSNNGFPLPLPSSSPTSPSPHSWVCGNALSPAPSVALSCSLVRSHLEHGAGVGAPSPCALVSRMLLRCVRPRTWLWIWLSCTRLCIAVQTLLCT